MSKTTLKETPDNQNEVILTAEEHDEEIEETDMPMSEEEFREQYQKLPLWQHVILVILFLFGMTAVIMVIDFAVEFVTELLKHIF